MWESFQFKLNPEYAILKKTHARISISICVANDKIFTNTEEKEENSRWNMNIWIRNTYNGRWKRLWVVTVVTVYDVHFEINDAMFFALFLSQFLISIIPKYMRIFMWQMRWTDIGRIQKVQSCESFHVFVHSVYELRMGRWSLDYNSMTKMTESHFFL